MWWVLGGRLFICLPCMLKISVLPSIIHITGAMVIICDMNEYRRAVKEFKVLVNIFHPPSLPGSNGLENLVHSNTQMKMLTFLFTLSHCKECKN